MRILHISDLHICSEFSEKYLEREKIKFLKTIKEVDDAKSIDFIIVTGDLIDGGSGNVDDKLTEAYCFLSRITEDIKIDISDIFITFGNHEIDRSKHDSFMEQSLIDRLDSSIKINKFIGNLDKKNIDRYLPYLKRFHDFQSNYFSENCTESTILNKKHIYKCKDNSIMLYDLNSAWRSSFNFEDINPYDDDGNIIIGERQFRHLPDKNEFDLNICFTHYPTDYLKKFERAEITENIVRNFDIFFCGHSHSLLSKQYNNGVENHQEHGSCVFINGYQLNFKNNLSDSKKYSNGFIIVDIENNLNEIIVQPYLYSDSVYKKQSGRKYLAKDSRKKLEAYISKKELMKKQIENFNEDLFTKHVKCNAPDNIEEIFVEPILEEISEEKNLYSLNKIMSSKENFIIKGKREAGKTTLLAAIYNKYYSIFSNKRDVIYIDYNKELNSDNFEKIIRKESIYLKSKYNEIIDEKQIIVLLDNIDFIKDEAIINDINSFLLDHENLKIIMTTEIILKSNHLIDEYEMLNNSIQININNFNSSQIKELSQKWLYNDQDGINQIVDIFLEFSLPSTPLNLNMLLWLYESGENLKKINAGMLLDNFVDKLLKKHSLSNIRFDTQKYYEYYIKIISKIALHMNDANRHYIEKEEIINIIKAYNNSINNINDPDDILDILINIGLLNLECLHERKYIYFRYRCYYSYFIAKSLESNFNKKFYNELLTDKEKFVNHYNEINLYTGLNQDDTNVFDFYLNSIIKEEINKFNEAFPEVKLDNIDEYFEKDYSFGELFKGASNISKKKKDQRNQMIQKSKKEYKDNKLSEIDNGIKEFKRENSNKKDFNYTIKAFTLGNMLLKNLNLIENYYDKKKKLISDIIDLGIIISFVFQKKLVNNIIQEDKNLEELSEVEKKELILLLLFSPILLESVLSEHIAYRNKKDLVEELIDSNEMSNFKSMLLHMLSFNIEKDYKKMKSYIMNEDYKYLLANLAIQFRETFYSSKNDSLLEKKSGELTTLLMEKLAPDSIDKSRELQNIKHKKMMKNKKDVN